MMRCPEKYGETMKDNIFREYDIRGIVGKDLLLDCVYDLGRAIATFLIGKHEQNRRVIIARDGRSHSLGIQQDIIRALNDSGFEIVDIGLCPSPAAYFAVYHLHIPAALVITASHNPKEYNGIKIWGAWGEQIQDIKRIYRERSFVPLETETQKAVNFYPIVDDYISYLVRHFSHLHQLEVNAVIDCGNGAAGVVLPLLIEEMKWSNVKLLFADVDGTFPNHEADPTVPENMQDVARELATDQSFKVGMGLDGDCDRMNPMTSDGYLVPGDKLLALFSKKVLANNLHAAVVCDIKSSAGPMEAMRKWGAKVCLAPSGHSLIKKAMAEHHALLAGELSCHFFFHDRYFGYDDGIYALLRTVELLHENQCSLQDLLQSIPARVSSPEIRIACNSDDEKRVIVETVRQVFASRTDLKDLISIDGMRAQTSYGWGLIRASNTQPVICLRFESDTKEGLQHIKQDFYTPLAGYFDAQELKEKIDL